MKGVARPTALLPLHLSTQAMRKEEAEEDGKC